MEDPSYDFGVHSRCCRLPPSPCSLPGGDQETSTCDKDVGRAREELKPVRTEGITLAALECSNGSGWQPGVDPDELWTMIGGWDGLKQMQTNTEVLLALASQAKAWNLGGSTLVAEQMQSEAIDMRRTAMRLKLGRICGYYKKHTAVYVQETACAYYDISERLLALYETSPSRRYGQLTAAVWPYTKAI